MMHPGKSLRRSASMRSWSSGDDGLSTLRMKDVGAGGAAVVEAACGIWSE